MYLDFYGLADRPFEITSNPRFLYYTDRHREALTNLEYGLSSAKAITVLLGQAGTGKTTLLRAALMSERCHNVRCLFVLNPTLTRGEFLETLAQQFGLADAASRSKSVFLSQVEVVLRERRALGEIIALVVDEAQSLSNDLLEEIRLLTNIETPEEKLLPLVLAGQPEFGERLNEPSLHQVKQRVALRCEILPLTLPETASYIAKRIRTAGGEAARLFTREAVMAIYEYTKGVPRTINVVCDNALISGFALGRQPVDRDIIMEVCRDFDLHDGAARANQAPQKERMFFGPPVSARGGSPASSPKSDRDEPSAGTDGQDRPRPRPFGFPGLR
jgi:general secretion pathway protein A